MGETLQEKEDSSFNYELKRAVKTYNLTAEHKIGEISAHILRHTGCTREAEDGMDIKVLQYLMELCKITDWQMYNTNA